MRERAFRMLSIGVLLGYALVAPNPSAAQDTCDVVISLDETASQVMVAYGLDYSAAGGEFLGSGFDPVCTKVFTGFENTLWDDDAGLLSNFVAAMGGGIPPTQTLISCVFALDGGFPCPPASAFGVVPADFSGTGLPPPFELPPPPALSIVVTPRIPVCGDGFREGSEQCDDGNVTDGDCCSSACVLDAAGTPCDDGSICTPSETCDAAGVCVPDSTITCDDGDACSTDACDPVLGCVAADVPAPPSQCDNTLKAAIDLRDRGEKSKLGFAQVSAHATTPAAVGNPTIDTDYALCIYDEVAEVAALRARIDVPAGALWQPVGASGTRYQYKDGTRSVNGVQRLRIEGKSGRVKVQLKADGANLVLPGPVAPDRYFTSDEHVSVQLRNTAGGCWSVEFDAAFDNTAERYRAKVK